MTNQEQQEPLLHRLQECYAIQVDHKSLPGFISDKHIKGDYWCFQKIPVSAGVLNISMTKDPGWSIEFGFANTGYADNPLPTIPATVSKGWGIEYNDDWIEYITRNTNNTLYIFGGPLYLSVVIEAFRCYIEQETLTIKDLTQTREKLTHNNPLLQWLEEFYFSCCEPIDPTYNAINHYYVCINMSMISTAQGWVIAIPLDDMIGGDNHFEPIFFEEEDGTIDCYKTDQDLLIMRTHFRGLITALTIFKEWAEANLI